MLILLMQNQSILFTLQITGEGKIRKVKPSLLIDSVYLVEV